MNDSRPQPGEVPTVHLVLEPIADPVPSGVRLRRLAKAILRSYGFKIVSITPALPDEVQEGERQP
jgi:hypothetical protein